MKTLLYIIIFVQIGLIKSFSQDFEIKSISLDNPDLKILYFGAYNELKIISDTPGLIIHSTDSRIIERKTDSTRYFIVQPLMNPDQKDECLIYLTTNDSVILDTISYKVRFLQCRYQTRFNDLKDYEMTTVKDLINQDKVEVYLPCSHYNKGFQIFKYKMIVVTKDGYVEFENQGNKIPPEIKEVFLKLKTNDKIIITSYGEPYPYHSITQQLEPLLIEIWEW